MKTRKTKKEKPIPQMPEREEKSHFLEVEVERLQREAVMHLTQKVEGIPVSH